MIRRPPRSTHCISSAASDVYKRQIITRFLEPACKKLVGLANTKDFIETVKRAAISLELVLIHCACLLEKNCRNIRASCCISSLIFVRVSASNNGKFIIII
eukprot:TRINITY_DN2460_c0_g1_i5.p2 TRINITY_DN2460_c0_g1~~TRINITY_DN2460_c0_g1_i5.p2  ORF type:complete len:108 (-),score=2.47 TRINITY_DN2460_c0_g1_i5:597-899(-)